MIPIHLKAGDAIFMVLRTTRPQGVDRSLTMPPTMIPSKETRIQVPEDLQVLHGWML
jgi:hypothetical protein